MYREMDIQCLKNMCRDNIIKATPRARHSIIRNDIRFRLKTPHSIGIGHTLFLGQ